MISIENQSICTINGRQLNVIDLYPDRRTAIVFVHGRCLSVKSWANQLASEDLSAYRLVAFDLPGHGESEHSNNPLVDYSLQGFINTLVNVVETLGLTEFVLVGCSLGGHIALEALPHLPGCHGVFAMTMPITKPARFDQMFKQMELINHVFHEQPIREVVEEYLTILLRYGAHIPTFLAEDYYRTDIHIHKAIVQSIVTGAYADESEIIRESAVPVAVVVGIEEQFHNLDYLKQQSLPLWGGSPCYVPDAGHLVGWENPAALNKLLDAFAKACFNII